MHQDVKSNLKVPVKMSERQCCVCASSFNKRNKHKTWWQRYIRTQQPSCEVEEKEEAEDSFIQQKRIRFFKQNRHMGLEFHIPGENIEDVER